MLPGLPGNALPCEPLYCCLKMTTSSPWHVGALQSPLVSYIIRDMHKHILKVDLFWYCSVRKCYWNPSKLFFPLNLCWRQRYWLTLVGVSGAVTALEERRRIPAKALSYIHVESLNVNSVHRHSLLTGLKVFMDCCIKSCVWGKSLRWCEVFLKLPRSMWKTSFYPQT